MKCAICGVRMTKGSRWGPKPIVCSRSVCRKSWAMKHKTLDYPPSSWKMKSWYNQFLRENPDAWDDYFDSE